MLGLDADQITYDLELLKHETTSLRDLPPYADPIEAMYRVHELGFDTVEHLNEMALGIQNMDMNSARVEKVRKNMTIPKFVDYNPTKITMHKSTISGITDKIKTIVQKVPKYKFSFNKDSSKPPHKRAP